MTIDIVTIFPEYFTGPLDAALLGKARAKGLLDIRVHDLRAHTTDKHRTVDDEPFGGGPGMVMMAQPWFEAVEAIDGWERARRARTGPARRTRRRWRPHLVSRALSRCGRRRAARAPRLSRRSR